MVCRAKCFQNELPGIVRQDSHHITSQRITSPHITAKYHIICPKIEVSQCIPIVYICILLCFAAIIAIAWGWGLKSHHITSHHTIPYFAAPISNPCRHPFPHILTCTCRAVRALLTQIASGACVDAMSANLMILLMSVTPEVHHITSCFCILPIVEENLGIVVMYFWVKIGWIFGEF